MDQSQGLVRKVEFGVEKPQLAAQWVSICTCNSIEYIKSDSKGKVDIFNSVASHICNNIIFVPQNLYWTVFYGKLNCSV